MGRFGWIAVGVAGLGALWAFAAVAKPGGKMARNRARDLFEVSPGCERIAFKGLPDDADESTARAAFSKLDSFYIDPMIAELAAQDITDPAVVTTTILDDIFPECRGQFPPDVQLSNLSKMVVWGAMLLHVTERIGAR